MPPATASANFLHICSILSVRPMVTPQGTPLHVYTLRLSEGAREPASDINHTSQLEPESAFTRVHSPSKTGVNAHNDALCAGMSGVFLRGASLKLRHHLVALASGKDGGL